MIGIICADDREVRPFIPMIIGCETTEKAMLAFHQGKMKGVDVVALYAGSCKTNAALATQILIDTYGCDVIINAGTAGGMAPGVELLDTVICTESAYYDVSPATLTQYHPMLGSIFFKTDEDLLTAAKKAVSTMDTGHMVYFGRMVTGEQFIVQKNRDHINRRLSPLSVDMETAAIAHVCHVNQIPFIAVRTITDTAVCSGEEYYQKNCDEAAQISADIVGGMLAVLREMKYDALAQSQQSNAMKEKFIRLLQAEGLSAEMGLTPVTDLFVMHMEREDGGSSDYWFVETDGDIQAKLSNFVRWNIGRYLFACVENEDYRNARYAVGEIRELKDVNDPEGISEPKDFMTLTFEELASTLKQI